MTKRGDYSEAVKVIRDLFQKDEQESDHQTRQRLVEEGNGNGVPGPPHLHPRRHGQDRNLGGPLQSGRTTNDFIHKEFR